MRCGLFVLSPIGERLLEPEAALAEDAVNLVGLRLTLSGRDQVAQLVQSRRGLTRQRAGRPVMSADELLRGRAIPVGTTLA